MANIAYYVPWVGSDEGVPDYSISGSLHLSVADYKSFFKDMRDAEKAEAERLYGPNRHVPGYYKRPDGEPKRVKVDDATYAKLVASKNGIRARRRTTETFYA